MGAWAPHPPSIFVMYYTLYDVTPEDDRFVMIRVNSSGEIEAELIIVQNWLGEVEGG